MKAARCRFLGGAAGAAAVLFAFSFPTGASADPPKEAPGGKAGTVEKVAPSGSASDVTAAKERPAAKAEKEIPVARKVDKKPGPPARKPGAAKAAGLGFSSGEIEQLGFAARIPASAEGWLSLYHLDDWGQAVESSKVWQHAKVAFEAIEEAEGDDDGENAEEDEDEELPEEVEAVLEDLFSEEVHLVFCEGSADRFDVFMQLYRLYDRAYWKVIFSGGQEFPSAALREVSYTPSATPAAAKPKKDAEDESELVPENVVALFGSEIDAAAGLAPDLAMPPLLLVARVKDPEALQEVLAEVEIDEDDPVTRTKFQLESGEKFASWRVELSALLTNPEINAMVREVGEDERPKLRRLLKRLQEKTVELAFGIIDDEWAVMSIGENHDHLVFAGSPAESLLSRKKMASVQPYLRHPLIAGAYFDEGFSATLVPYHPLGPILEVAQEVMGGQEQFAKVFEELAPRIEAIVAQGDALYEHRVSESASIAFWDDALVIESFGGMIEKGYDLAAKHHLATPDADSAFLTYHAVANEGFSLASWQYFEDLVTLFYETGNTVAQQAGPEAAMVAAAQGMVVPQVVALYEAFKSVYVDGMSGESMVVIDLEGSMPAVPGLPAALFQKGRIPRLAQVNRVEDRSAITEGWEEMKPVASQLMGIASMFGAMGGQAPEDGAPPAMQLPEFLSSEKDGLTTYFFPFPFTSNNFLPSVSVSDELFMLSTSKDFSEAIAAANAKEAKGKAADREEQSGVRLQMNFASLQPFVENWVNLSGDLEGFDLPGSGGGDAEPPKKKNKKKGSKKNREKGKKNRKQAAEEAKPTPQEIFQPIGQLLEALGVLSVRVYEEKGELRSTTRWSIRDVE